MREIKFRGKRVDCGVFICGYYFYSELEDKHYIIGESKDYGFQKEEVIPETVGQYIGIKDINNEEIYDGDIVNGVWVIEYVCENNKANVGLDCGWYMQRDNFESYAILVCYEEEIEVTGNIHNKEND